MWSLKKKNRRKVFPIFLGGEGYITVTKRNADSYLVVNNFSYGRVVRSSTYLRNIYAPSEKGKFEKEILSQKPAFGDIEITSFVLFFSLSFVTRLITWFTTVAIFERVCLFFVSYQNTPAVGQRSDRYVPDVYDSDLRWAAGHPRCW